MSGNYYRRWPFAQSGRVRRLMSISHKNRHDDIVNLQPQMLQDDNVPGRFGYRLVAFYINVLSSFIIFDNPDIFLKTETNTMRGVKFIKTQTKLTREKIKNKIKKRGRFHISDIRECMCARSLSPPFPHETSIKDPRSLFFSRMILLSFLVTVAAIPSHRIFLIRICQTFLSSRCVTHYRRDSLTHDTFCCDRSIWLFVVSFATESKSLPRFRWWKTVKYKGPCELVRGSSP